MASLSQWSVMAWLICCRCSALLGLPAVAKHSSIDPSARGPCPQVPQRHPGVAKHSSINPSALGSCPQVPQRHPRMAKHSSIDPSARGPCPQIPQRHPGVAKVAYVGFSALKRVRHPQRASARLDGGRVERGHLDI